MSPAQDEKTIANSGSATLVLPASPHEYVGSNNILPIGTRLFEFEITRLVGEGGFGIVYAAHDHSLDRDVAIKEYMPNALATRQADFSVSVRSDRHTEMFEVALRSFVNEARLLARFDHPSLVKVYRFWEANGTAYMAMPLYQGVTLKQRLREWREQGVAVKETWLLTMLDQLLDALEIIHGEQCFHRDIAPDNILLVEGDRPVLLDFGAARRVIGDLTHSLTAILKPGYAPLEQYAEIPSMLQGPWTDIYALAATLYFALTGKPPEASVGRMMVDPVIPLAIQLQGQYSAGFLAAIDAGLKVRPEDRPQNLAEFRALLGGRAQVADTSRRPRASEVVSTERQPARAQWVPIALIVSLFGALTISGWFILRDRFSSPQSATIEPAPIAAVPVASAPNVSVPNAAVIAAQNPTIAASAPVAASVEQPHVEAQPAPPAAAPKSVDETPAAAQNIPTDVASKVHADRSSPTKPAETSADKMRKILTDAEANLARRDFLRAKAQTELALTMDPNNARALELKQRVQSAMKAAAFDEIKIE